MKRKSIRLGLECSCGKSKLVADAITLALGGVPFILTEDGPEYDDSEAEYSSGWDYCSESRCRCASCGVVYEIAANTDARLYLEKMEKRNEKQ